MKKYKIQKNIRVSHNNESSEKYLKNKSKEGFAKKNCWFGMVSLTF